MFVSMTGYGQGESGSESVRFQVVLRAVNHRFCDVIVKAPREYMALESRLVTSVKQVFRRGRVELHLHRIDDASSGKNLHFNIPLAKRFHQQLTELCDALGMDGGLPLTQILALDGVISEAPVTRDIEAEWPYISAALDEALEAAQRMRNMEGEALGEDVRSRIARLKGCQEAIVGLSANLRANLESKLEAKVMATLDRAQTGEIDRGRLLQEVVYLVDRADISEEITRLASHLVQLDALLDEQDVVGKRIDFLIQEILRETNTIGSKSTVEEVIRHGMTIKVELEKIREQIQNIE